MFKQAFFCLLAIATITGCDSSFKSQLGADSRGTDGSVLTASPADDTNPEAVVESGTTSACSYDNDVYSLGLGVVMAPEKFSIYADASGEQVFREVDVYADHLAGLCAKFQLPDYAIMHFVCLDTLERTFKVLTDYSTVKYLSRGQGADFLIWEDYIMKAFGIRRKNATSHRSLKAEPGETASNLDIPEGLEMFCPIQVKGDWLEVKYDCFYNRDANPHEGEPCDNFISECDNPLRGWLRWREGNTLLIDIFLMP